MDITESLKEIIKTSPTAPFLFIGSGFSRRYLGLEDWKGLLSKFGARLPAGSIRYISESNGDLALAAEKMSQPYSDYWWSLPNSQEVANQQNWHTHISSPLRHDICEYLKAVTMDEKKLQDELNVLTSNQTIIDGIITTNWDLLLENIFINEKYKVYIGQSNLLFSNPQKIAEIYKIHGCCTDPKSLVLTKLDYDEFHKKNPYLAAKLLSIFLEHPVLFIGYSLHDENIKSILCSISEMMTNNEHKQKLANNLIFLNRSHDGDDSISKTHFAFEEGQSIPITQIKTDDYSKVYKAFQARERKIPAYLLRVFREQFYEIVQGDAPEKKLYCATNIDEIMDGKSEIEFVAGFGLSRGKIGDIGLQGIEIENLLRDIIYDDIQFEKKEILTKTLPRLKSKGKYIPVHKFLKNTDVTREELKKLDLNKLVERNKKYYLELIPTNYQNTYKNRGFTGVQDIIDSSLCDTGKFEVLSCYILKNKSDLEVINDFLKVKFDKNKKNSSFKRLVCIYDLVKYK